MEKVLMSSKNMNWCTPKKFFDNLDEEFHFVLDPAATPKSAKCKLFYTPQDDGLSKSWDFCGAVFCNPPYGREIRKWVKKAYEEAQKGVTVVMLIPAITDTSYFHDYIYNRAEIRFLRGRLHFEDENKKQYPAAPFPSMVVIFNNKSKEM